MARKKKDEAMSMKLSSPLAMSTRQNSRKEGKPMAKKMPKTPSLKSQMKKVRVVSSTASPKKRREY
jgi:hypothetical protein